MLSIIILNYNTRDLTLAVIDSIIKTAKGLAYEIIVVDNGSTENIQINKYPNTQIIRNKENLGFAAGNNKARNAVKGEYVLFLNSDTLTNQSTLKDCVRYLDNNQKVGALTCKQVLPSGEVDKDARRSFPTPWVALTHFSYLDRIFPKSKLFSKYWYGYVSADETHEIDVFQGAFAMIRKSILDGVNWFSEDYFLDGEDIDLAWKIKQKGWKIIYYPKVSIVHLKKATKKKVKGKFIKQGVDSMEIFYKKYLWNRYPWILNILVILGIRSLRFLRSI